jgi:hypothetical protein
MKRGRKWPGDPSKLNRPANYVDRHVVDVVRNTPGNGPAAPIAS